MTRTHPPPLLGEVTEGVSKFDILPNSPTVNSPSDKLLSHFERKRDKVPRTHLPPLLGEVTVGARGGVRELVQPDLVTLVVRW